MAALQDLKVQLPALTAWVGLHCLPLIPWHFGSCKINQVRSAAAVYLPAALCDSTILEQASALQPEAPNVSRKTQLMQPQTYIILLWQQDCHALSFSMAWTCRTLLSAYKAIGFSKLTSSSIIALVLLLGTFPGQHLTAETGFE